MAQSKANTLTLLLLNQIKMGQELKLKNEEDISLKTIGQMCEQLLINNRDKQDIREHLMTVFVYLDKISNNKINLNKENVPFLSLAIEQKYRLECLEWLIARSCDVNFTQPSIPNALYCAVKMRNVAAVDLLLKHKIKFNFTSTYNPIYALAYHDGKSIEDKKEIIKSLIDGGMKIDDCTPLGSTLLQAECEKVRNGEIIEYILSLGANALKKNNEGKSAIDIAILGPTHSSFINNDLQNLQAIINATKDSSRLEIIDIAINTGKKYCVHGALATAYLQEIRQILFDKRNLSEHIVTQSPGVELAESEKNKIQKI